MKNTHTWSAGQISSIRRRQGSFCGDTKRSVPINVAKGACIPIFGLMLKKITFFLNIQEPCPLFTTAKYQLRNPSESCCCIALRCREEAVFRCCLMGAILLFLVLLGVLLPCAHTLVGVPPQARPLSPSLADGVRRDHIFELTTSTCSSNAHGPRRRASKRNGRVLMATEEVSGCLLGGYSWTTRFGWSCFLHLDFCTIHPATEQHKIRLRAADAHTVRIYNTCTHITTDRTTTVTLLCTVRVRVRKRSSRYRTKTNEKIKVYAVYSYLTCSTEVYRQFDRYVLFWYIAYSEFKYIPPKTLSVSDVLFVVLHAVQLATLDHPIEPSKPAARAKVIRLIVSLEVPRPLERRPYLASVRAMIYLVHNFWRNKPVHDNKIRVIVFATPVS